jgi:SAM-dependent methyltransferase
MFLNTRSLLMCYDLLQMLTLSCEKDSAMTMPFDESAEAERRFAQRYREGSARWDTGISPPELLAAITGPTALPPVIALDIGCGTGTNSIALAERGWRVTGVDFVQDAIDQAVAKAEQVQDAIRQAGGSVRFLRADVTTLGAPAAEDKATLLLDIGCLNSIPLPLRPAYARVAADYAAPGALFLLYAHMPNPDAPGPLGCTPEEVTALFGASFVITHQEIGEDAASGTGSFWTWLTRREITISSGDPSLE